MQFDEKDSSASADYDPVFLNSRREAIVIFLVWVAGLLWAVPFCYFCGYIDHVDPSDVKPIFGIPAWLFWGVAVPWIVADIVTGWFCFRYMRDDDLGVEPATSDHVTRIEVEREN